MSSRTAPLKTEMLTASELLERIAREHGAALQGFLLVVHAGGQVKAIQHGLDPGTAALAVKVAEMDLVRRLQAPAPQMVLPVRGALVS